MGLTWFYTGSHKTGWLCGADIRKRAPWPLFISHLQLRDRVHLYPTSVRWALDSGGFTILKDHGRWTVSPAEYVTAVRRYRDTIGRLDWAAPQDWMCEPAMIYGGRFGGLRFVGTRLSVREHQERTVANYLELTALAPDLPIIPVLQGWDLHEYERCIELYAAAGVDLWARPVVGLGSVCRRQSTQEIATVVAELARTGLRLHGFGVKTGGLGRYGHHLVSADSLAWSLHARRRPPLAGHPHANCANCQTYAGQWRTGMLDDLERSSLRQGIQGDLFGLLQAR